MLKRIKKLFSFTKERSCFIHFKADDSVTLMNHNISWNLKDMKIGICTKCRMMVDAKSNLGKNFLKASDTSKLTKEQAKMVEEILLETKNEEKK